MAKRKYVRRRQISEEGRRNMSLGQLRRHGKLPGGSTINNNNNSNTNTETAGLEIAKARIKTVSVRIQDNIDRLANLAATTFERINSDLESIIGKYK